MVAVFELQATQDCVDSGCCIRHKHYRLGWSIDEIRYRAPGLIEVDRILVADEVVRTGFGGVLEGTEC
jgi:hypothetical protein